EDDLAGGYLRPRPTRGPSIDLCAQLPSTSVNPAHAAVVVDARRPGAPPRADLSRQLRPQGQKGSHTTVNRGTNDELYDQRHVPADGPGTVQPRRAGGAG